MSTEAGRAAPTEARRLAAIMFTDIVGFSRHMGADEARMLRLLGIHNQIIQHAVAEHHGAVIKTVGDAFLVDFPSVVNAVQCAQQMQTHLRAHNAAKELDEQIHVRIGIHLGDIVQQDGDVFGDGVNIASRLQTSAEPDTICISQKVYEEVEKKIPLGTVLSLGRPQLKNIAQRQHIYLLLPEQPKGLRQAFQVQRLKLLRRVGTASLSWPALTLAGLVLIAGTTLTVRSLFLPTPHIQPLAPNTPPLPLLDKPSIVVLPFVNMSKDPEQEYFSDGLTEDLITDLSKFSGLFVIARNSSFTYKGKAVKVQEVSREMGVRYVLEGSVRKTAKQVRVTVQLIDATTGHHVWAERYDRSLTDIFAVQDEVVQQIGATLRVEVREAEQARVRRVPTANLTAYDAWLHGIEDLRRGTQEANAQARQWFERAVESDPQYAEAYAWLGWTYHLEWARWNHAPALLERANEFIRHALTLDDSLPRAHQFLGAIYVWQKQPDQAIAEGKRALALDPNNADAYAMLAGILNFAGRPAEAIGLAQQAMRLNPRYPAPYPHMLGIAYTLSGQYVEAITAYKEALRRNPNDLGTYHWLTINYVEQWGGQWSQDPQTLAHAEEVAKQVVALSDSTFWAHGHLSVVYLWQKRYDDALTAAERAVALGANDPLSHAYLGFVLNSVGQPTEALERMEPVTCSAAFGTTPAFCFRVLGDTYYLTGRHEEAIMAFQQALSHHPWDQGLGERLKLAASYSALGKEAEARAEAAEVLRLNPKFSLEIHKERAPIKDPALLERHIAALRKAGLK